MGATDFFRLLPLTIIPLNRLRRNGYGRQALPFGATNRAHLKILAQMAKPPQLMVTLIFKARYPCKHWSKRVPGAIVSSMFITYYVIYHVVFLTSAQNGVMAAKRLKRSQKGEARLEPHHFGSLIQSIRSK